MSRCVVAMRILLLCISNTISVAYTPNNFYPALRGSSLFPPRARSRHWAPKPLAVQSKTVETPLEAPPVEPPEFPLLSPKDKRLMGIFRCYGWGPGCSDSSFFAPKQGPSSPSSSSSSSSSLTPFSQQTRSHDDEMLDSQKFKTSSTVLQQRTSPTGPEKFEPFFTLTSGGSWGPTGRKRDGMRRYSVAEKRLDFLKQILRDMLEETDEDDSDGSQRPLGIRRPTKRYTPYRRTPGYSPDASYDTRTQRWMVRQLPRMTGNRFR